MTTFQPESFTALRQYYYHAVALTDYNTNIMTTTIVVGALSIVLQLTVVAHDGMRNTTTVLARPIVLDVP